MHYYYNYYYYYGFLNIFHVLEYNSRIFEYILCFSRTITKCFCYEVIMNSEKCNINNMLYDVTMIICNVCTYVFMVLW